MKTDSLIKKIRKSIRGLTFSTNDTDRIGTKYRYIIKGNGDILILSDEEGSGTVSRKRSGSSVKALYDIRSKEVRDIVSSADYMEVEIDSASDRIIVHVYRKATEDEKRLCKDLVTIDDVICRRSGLIMIDRASLADIPEDDGIDTVPSDVYRVMSLFSGAGLFDCAFKTPRFDFVYAVDFDENACRTYRENIGDHIRCMDIRDADPEDIPDADLCLASPCCQAYSNENRHNIDSDTGEMKRLLVSDFVRLTAAKLPKVWVVENVPQILTRSEGRYLDIILSGLPGYEITSSVVCDSDLGGYTTRKRAIIIGSRIGRIDLPDTKLTPGTVRDALSKVDAGWFNFADVTGSSEKTQRTMSYVPQGGNWRCVPDHIHHFLEKTHSNIYRRLSWDEQAPTIVNWRKSLMMPPVGNRILSVSEAAALMGLDRDFRILGSSLDARQQQIGNGVTQAIARHIRDTVLQALDAFTLKTV